MILSNSVRFSTIGRRERSPWYINWLSRADLWYIVGGHNTVVLRRYEAAVQNFFGRATSFRNAVPDRPVERY